MTDFDIGAMMGQLQQLQEQASAVQKELENATVEGSAGAGMVRVKANGVPRITAIEIDPSVVDEDREMLQDLIVAAANNALDKAREKAAELTQQRFGAMLPPGLAGQFPGL